MSEVIRAAQRLLAENENKPVTLREAIHKGIESGIAIDFNPTNHLEGLKAKRN